MATILLLANPGSNRARFVEEAARDAGAATRVVAWESLLREDEDAWGQLRDAGDSIIRIESPGRDAEVEMLLLKWGEQVAAEFLMGEQLWNTAQIDSRLPDKGRIVPMRQWYAGWCRLLHRVKTCAPQARFSHDVAEVVAMFDKPATHQMLQNAGVPVPPSAGIVRRWDDLKLRMQVYEMSRVFLKPRHGSSASGVIALETHRGEMQAFAPVEMSQGEDGAVRLYNSRHVQRIRNASAICDMVDALGSTAELHTERWMPKMGYCRRRCDLRVVVIGGKARHVVVRLSPHPMTNLHLGGTRGDAPFLRESIGEAAWHHALEVCERAASAFPRSISVGVDLLLAPGGRDPRVLEVNAFGGLLPGELLNGWDTYRWEMEEMLRPGSTTALHVSCTGA